MQRLVAGQQMMRLAARLSTRSPAVASASKDSKRARKAKGPQHRLPGSERGVGSNAPAAAAAAAAATAPAAAPAGTARALSVLSRFRALVLDSSYRPIDVVNWQRAICMDLLDKADVLEYYEASVSSVSSEFFLPAVVRARRYRGGGRRHARVALNRRHVMLRDGYQCQYCGRGRESDPHLTIDHVVPASKGGPNSWENLVTACSDCNSHKGSKTLKELRWKLRSTPREPSPHEMNSMLAVLASDLKQLPAEWASYIGAPVAGPINSRIAARLAGRKPGQ